MTGLRRVSDPILTERSILELSTTEGTFLLPFDPAGIEHGPGETRPDLVNASALVPHRHDASVAAAEPAAHQPLDGHLARLLISHGDVRRRTKHAFRTARVNHQRRLPSARGERALERIDHASAFAGAAVFGR